MRVIPATRQASGHTAAHSGKKCVAAYCRVSTDSEEQLNSDKAQLAYYTRKIEETPDWEMAGVFADEGITGTSLKKRKEFNRMIAACKRGRIDLIVTKSLSRFARNTVDCLETVRMLKANGIGVLFEKENINTLTESSEFLITLFSGFAQAESESLSKNVVWGLQKSREAEVIRRIYERYLEGHSLEEIKQELEADDIPAAMGVKGWSKQVIRNILTNEKYTGDARKVLQKSAKTEQGKYSAKHALSELLVCGECGTPYKRVTWARNGKKRVVWRCVSRLEFGTKYCQNSPTLDEGKLHNAILAALNGYADLEQAEGSAWELARLAQSGREGDGVSMLTLEDRLAARAREQETQGLLKQVQALQQREEQQAARRHAWMRCGRNSGVSPKSSQHMTTPLPGE